MCSYSLTHIHIAKLYTVTLFYTYIPVYTSALGANESTPVGASPGGVRLPAIGTSAVLLLFKEQREAIFRRLSETHLVQIITNIKLELMACGLYIDPMVYINIGCARTQKLC